MKTGKDSIDLMNDEFDAAKALADQYRRVTMTAVVDDDFPLVKSDYDRAADTFVTAYVTRRLKKGTLTDTLTFEFFEHQNLSRALRWHPGGLETWSLSDWATATAGEVGEMCNVIKKLNRFRDNLQGNKKRETWDSLRQQLKDEIGDVATYLDLLAQAAGFTLRDCIRDKFNEISEREGFPERL